MTVTDDLAIWPVPTDVMGCPEPIPRAAIEACAPEGADADAANLQGGIADLANLVTGALALDELLARVATIASRAIPGADGAGVTLLRPSGPENRVEAIAASSAFVRQIDQIQYVDVAEGPGITAVLQRESVWSGSLGGEKRWPRLGPRVGRLGVHSVLSLPLLLPNQLVGAISIYAHGKNLFAGHSARLGERFAAPAAVVVYNAQILAQARTLTTQLQTALVSRPVIDQAIGILIARTGGTADEAFARLRVISQGEHTKLTTVAQHILDEAARRARARHCQH